MPSCSHAGPHVLRACTHLLVATHGGYTEAFTGHGVSSDLLCESCAAADDRTHVVDACDACARLARNHGWNGVAGTPELVTATSTLVLVHDELELPGCPALVDLQPIVGADRNRWIGLAADGTLSELDLDARTVRVVARAPAELVDPAQPHPQIHDEPLRLALQLSPDARFAAVVHQRGVRGVIIELATGRVTMTLVRDDDDAEHCNFPIAFVTRGDRTLVVDAPLSNRLEVSDARTGELVTERASTASTARGEPHYLDYYHCGLLVSPNQQRIADAGWCWHPDGEVTSWSLERWLDENPWESEDGTSRRTFARREWFWDGPMCWLDDARLAVWGYGEDRDWLVDGVMIHDSRTGTLERWFAGTPRGDLIFDELLHVLGDGRLTVWDVARGARLFDAPTSVVRYHPTAKCFVALPNGPRVTIAHLCDHLADASWNHGVVRELAAAIARERDFDGLPILADALEAAGCDDPALLAHCRTPGPHAGRCWVLDRLALTDAV